MKNLMNSTELIKKAKEAYSNLEDKKLDWVSFYTGFLSGYGINYNKDRK